MNIEIKGSNDEFFTIQTKEMGEVWVASDGRRSVIAKTEQDAVEFFESLPAPVVEVKEEVVEEIPQPPYRGPLPAPIENPKSNNFDLFAGTSWAGKRQPH
jgi:hypothetical protein